MTSTGPDLVDPALLQYYAEPSPTSVIEAHDDALAGLPGTTDGAIRWARNVVLHVVDVVAFGVDVDAVRLDEAEIRTAQGIVDRVLSLQPDPLAVMRDPERRLIGNCQHLALLAASLLRHAGVPARVRFGFVPYIHRGCLEDHCIVEAWADGQWQRFDPGMAIPAGHPLLDSFIGAGDAWLRCAAGADDADRYGAIDLYRTQAYRGAFYLRNSVLHDLASLCKLDLHPCDWWGLMLDQEADDVDELVDEIARLTLDDDSHQERLDRFWGDARLHPSDEVMFLDARRSEMRSVTLPEGWLAPASGAATGSSSAPVPGGGAR